ncbi:LacI family transcriptional regulator [Lichenicoccus roseus]|uniref:LacI family transcriptional regulator n=2 Tax=Lichenicoccus roseus TaxID=2683649 RepID=A0A5R9JGZ4_9PROT|nr:LacI family transcriptional regulator [Lichenicoccus roseus]
MERRAAMRRPTITDLAREAEVSISTVDRVLNGRLPVHPQTASRVLAAADRIGFYAAGLIRQRLEAQAPARRLGFVLQQRSAPFYQALGAALREAVLACRTIRGQPVIEYLDDLTPAAVSDALRRIGGQTDALALVAADHAHVSRAIDELHEQAVPVFALLSDLTAPTRAGYAGLDSRKAGRFAGWAISRLARVPGPVAIMLGSHRYLGHELCELGYRSYFRETGTGGSGSSFKVLEALVSLEEPRLAYEATADLLRRTPDLVGLYVAGGGIEGVIGMLRDRIQGGETGHLVTVCNELTGVTRAALIDGIVDVVIAHPLERIANDLVAAMIHSIGRPSPAAPVQVMLPFELYTPENL